MVGQQTDQDEVEADEGGLPAGTVLDDKFRVERLLGMGGMGAVYEITHMLTKHRRAMKLLHPQYAQQKMVVERFFREASAAGHIGNDHIIETFDAGWLASGEPYLVMEFLGGMPLTDRIEEQPQGMDLGEAVEIFEQLCDGVQAAHDAGIVHRDLKPDNVFLARGAGEWRVKVLDFGVSKFDEKLATKLTSGGSMVGTPAYMSPEQFDRGADVDPPSDVYALGVILYELLTGVHPYPAETMAQLVKMIVASSPVPMTELRPDLPPAVQALLDQMITIEVEDRISSPREAATRLKAIVEEAGADLALHSTALSDPRDLALKATSASDAAELGLQNTVASDRPPSSRTPSSRSAGVVSSRRAPESLAKTDVMVEEAPASEPPGSTSERRATRSDQDPAPRVGSAVTLVDGSDAHGDTEPAATTKSTSPVVYGAVAVVALGIVAAATQLGGSETSDAADAASATATTDASAPPPEPTASAQPPEPEPTATEAPEGSATVAAPSSTPPPLPAPPAIPRPPPPTPAAPKPPPTSDAIPPEQFGE